MNRVDDLAYDDKSLYKYCLYLMGIGKCQKALALALEILKKDSENANVMYVVALALYNLGNLDEAEEMTKNAILYETKYDAESYKLLGLIYHKKADYIKIVKAFEQALICLNGLKNNFSAGIAQGLGHVYGILGDIETAKKYYLLAHEWCKDEKEKLENYSSYLLCCHYNLSMDETELLAVHRQYQKLLDDVKQYRHCIENTNERKLRIGYISPDFREHVMINFYYALLNDYDKNKFFVACYSLGEEDEFTTNLKPLPDMWCNLQGKSYADSAAIIYNDKIDILIDLAGHSANSGLPILAFKPAPIQISGLGYFNTTGLDTVDYFITDVNVDPEGKNDDVFTEKLLRLPHSHFCYTQQDILAKSKGAPCLKNGYITFGSFNQYAKVTDEVLAIWGKILERVPNSILVLKAQSFVCDEAVAIAKERLKKFNFDLTRVKFEGTTKNYMERYLDIDIALDTYPYQGGGTTCDALYMGVPVITMVGKRHGARFGYSLLKNVGLEELIAENEQTYIDKAVFLALDQELLQLLHKKLRSIMQTSSLMNVEQYMTDIENAYQFIWKKYRSPLVSILIPTFNRPQYFQVALESALRQTYSNIEIIICDNSTDNRTETLIEQYKHDRRIRYMRNREAKTKEANFQPFEHLVKGEYIQWLMDDDVLEPEKIDLMMKCFIDNPDVRLVTSCRRWIDQCGNELEKIKKIQFNESNTIINGRSLGKAMLLNMSNLIGEPSAFLFRKKDLLHHYWNADCKGYKRISDVVMGLELLEKGNCGYFSDALSSYRWHSEQEGQQPDVIIQSRLEWLNIVKEYYHKQCFIDNVEEYDKSLHHWLNDANDVLTQLSGKIIDKVLLIKYKEKIAEVNQYLNKKINLSLVYEKLAQGDFAAMIPILQVLLKEHPDNYELLTKLSGAYIECRMVNEAEFTIEKLIKLNHNDLFTRFLQAKVYYLKGNLPEVIEILVNFATNSDDGEDEVISLICNLLANVYGILGDCKQSTNYYLKGSKASIGSYDKAIDYSNYLFHLNYLPQINQQALYQAHLGYNEIFKNVQQFSHLPSKKKNKLRIGYLSPDFREHVVTFFSYVFFACYDKEKFEVICFSRGMEDSISSKIKSLVDGWINIRYMDADNAAKKIYEQQIDILVDLSGHTKNNCLPILAQKPVPIQVCGIGYFNTTGLKAVDYFLTDVYCDPYNKNDAYFSEKLLRLPHSHFCYTSLREDVPMATVPCLKNGYITFGCFNNYTKVNNEVLLVWKEIFKKLPNARLILKSSVLGNKYCLPLIQSRFKKLGLPLERIEFRPETYPYLHEYNDIDIALDTFPYPGGGTTCDALYMGVPVITLIGERHGSRFGYSILKNIGLEELSTNNKAEYIDRAIGLANDKELLAILHNNLRTMMQKSSLMNSKQYMEDVEAMYYDVWNKYQQNN